MDEQTKKELVEEENHKKGFTIEINKVTVEAKKSLKTRTITALVLLAICIPCVILGGWFFFSLMSILEVFAIYEFVKVTGKKYHPVIWLAIYIATLSFSYWVFFQGNTAYQQSIATYSQKYNDFVMMDIRVSTMGVGFLIAFLFGWSIFDSSFDIKDVMYLFTMSVFMGLAIQSILFLRFSPQALASDDFVYSNKYLSCLFVIYVEGVICLNDVFAYLTGMLFGKHKMNPRVSPKKTWEGFFGGIILSAICGTLFVVILDLNGIPVLKGIIDIEHIYYVILLSLIMPFVGVLGDLMFSLIKRNYGIKDYGKIFPGHGGVLDRFDSLLITAIIVTVIITFLYHMPFSNVGL